MQVTFSSLNLLIILSDCQTQPFQMLKQVSTVQPDHVTPTPHAGNQTQGFTRSLLG